MRISKIFRLFTVVALWLCLALPAIAQPLGVLQSAETMESSVFKLMAAPIIIFGRDGADANYGFTARAGYGLFDRFDLEVKLGFLENGVLLGADGEYWILKGSKEGFPLDVSLTGGLHWMFADNNFDVIGVDFIPQISGNITKNLELCGAISATFESIQDIPSGVDGTYTVLHIVPGIEYRLSDAFDIVGEFGYGINDDSANYVGVGIAYYFR